jgi:hypothetical protein
VKATQKEQQALASALHATKHAPGPLESGYRPPVSTLPGKKAKVLPGQLSFDDVQEAER